jgi:hypothetical protein
MTIDPNNLNISKINLTSRIAKPLRSVLSTGKRMMSNGTFIKAMRTSLSHDTGDGITDRVAKKMALRAAVGVKDLGVTAKKEKSFFKKMNKEGMLSTMYKNSVKNAIDHYKTAAGELTSSSDSEHHVVVSSNQNNNPDDPSNKEDIATIQKRKQKIRDSIEAQKKEHHEKEVSIAHRNAADDTSHAVTSITHITDHPIVSAQTGVNPKISVSDPLRADTLPDSLEKPPAIQLD